MNPNPLASKVANSPAPATKLDRNDPVIVGHIHGLETIINAQNGLAIQGYNTAITSWHMQLGQYAFNDQRPLPVKPAPPVIQTLDEGKVVSILEEYYNRDFSGVTPGGELDLTPAYGHELYDPKDPIPVVVQINAVGALIPGQPTRRVLAAKYAAGPDQLDLGAERIGPDGLLYVLVDSESPFNRSGVWEQKKAEG